MNLVKTLHNPEKIEAWLESFVRAKLTPTISNYAKGRLECWLNIRPSLTTPIEHFKGLIVPEPIVLRIKELISWDFDYCLVTYSGDEKPAGILPHRDASYADYEAMSLNVSGQCKFDWWINRNAISASREFESLILEPGMLTHFNCKHLHAATPGIKRWNMNFWKAKPKSD